MVIGIILITLFNNFGPQQPSEERLSYSTFINDIKQGNVRAVTITEQNVRGVFHNNKVFTSYLPMRQDPSLIQLLLDKSVVIKGKPPEQPGLWIHLLNLLPWIYNHVLQRVATNDRKLTVVLARIESSNRRLVQLQPVRARRQFHRITTVSFRLNAFDFPCDLIGNDDGNVPDGRAVCRTDHAFELARTL